MSQIHLINRHLFVVSVDPNEVKRTTSKTFEESVERLKKDGHYQCFTCQTTEDLQVHHFGCEWQYEEIVDFNKLKLYCEALDPYGYGRLLQSQPITTVDDIRNLLVLCQEHHTGVDHADGGSMTGIHSGDLPTWNIQFLAKEGMIPVPQRGETAEDVLARIEKALGGGSNVPGSAS